MWPPGPPTFSLDPKDRLLGNASLILVQRINLHLLAENITELQPDVLLSGAYGGGAAREGGVQGRGSGREARSCERAGRAHRVQRRARRRERRSRRRRVTVRPRLGFWRGGGAAEGLHFPVSWWWRRRRENSKSRGVSHGKAPSSGARTRWRRAGWRRRRRAGEKWRQGGEKFEMDKEGTG